MFGQIWENWTAWLIFGVVLAALEVVLPGYIFLGFAAGAGVVALLVGLGVLTGAGFALTLLIFAVLSLAAWGLLRRFYLRKGQVKHWHRDINENDP